MKAEEPALQWLVDKLEREENNKIMKKAKNEDGEMEMANEIKEASGQCECGCNNWVLEEDCEEPYQVCSDCGRTRIK